MPTRASILLRRRAHLLHEQHLAVREHAADRVALGFVAGQGMACDIAALYQRWRPSAVTSNTSELFRRAEMKVDALAAPAGDGHAQGGEPARSDVTAMLRGFAYT